MQDALNRGLRIAGLALMAFAIAHCGDNDNFDNDNDNGNGGGTPIRTATPGGATPVRTSTPSSPTSPVVTPTTADTGSGGPTATPSPGGGENLCPGAISFEGNATTARLDTGWTGLAHEAKIIDRGKVTVATDCAGDPRPCGVCNLTGPIPNPDAGAGTSNNHRCSGDSSIECTGDGDCGGSGTCVFFFGAPLPLAAGGVSTCIINQVVGSITGTANIETGEAASDVNLISRVFSGLELSAPCPLCNGDPTPADGQRNGTCSGGTRAGQPCDVGGNSPTFEPTGNTSFDCPPLAGGVIGSLPIDLSNSTSTTTLTLSDANPSCRAAAGSGKKCFCDTCATLAAEPCSTNADCSGGAACGGLRCRGGDNNGAACTTAGVNTQCPGGACGVPGQPTAPNQCDGSGLCADVGNNNGECAEGPFEQFCSPQETFRGCTVNGDCPVAGDTCSLGKNRPCFLDNGNVGGSVTATGVADPPVDGVANPTLAAFFCIAPTTSGSVNAAAGLPGLGRLQLTGTATEIP